jgi:hypothetical protein
LENLSFSCALLTIPTEIEGKMSEMNGEHQAGHQNIDTYMRHSHSDEEHTL